MIHYSIDWIRATEPMNMLHEEIAKAQALFPTAIWMETGSPMPPYQEASISPYATLAWHREFAEFGLMLQMSGTQISAFRREGRDILRLIANMVNGEWRFTRLDLAIDLRGKPIAIKDLVDDWQAGTLKTIAHSMTRYTTETPEGANGETVYVGSRTSERFLRVYDKAAEQGHAGEHWTRIELELKGKYARYAAKQIALMGFEFTTRSMLRSVIQQSTVGWFENVFTQGGGFQPVSAIAEKQTDFELWFWKIVIPAIDRALKYRIEGAQERLEQALDTYRGTGSG